jgi:Uma2 family endonuclease
MGQMTSSEALILRWAELCADTRWHDLGGKLELNAMGVIEMSPASNRHGARQMAVGHALMSQLPQGTTITECSVQTSDGIRVPDVAWASPEFMAAHGDSTPFPRAPEICVEIRSPSNTDAEMAFKTRLYLAAGAQEVWVVSEDGSREVFNSAGPQPDTRFGVRL